MGECIGISFMDSASLEMCRNQRIYNHKVLKTWQSVENPQWAGFMDLSYIWCVMKKVSFYHFTRQKENVDDINLRHIKKMTKELFGKLFTDKGYLSKALWEMLFADGIQLFTKF
nr:transposase [Elizabethkingia anophelis]